MAKGRKRRRLSTRLTMAALGRGASGGSRAWWYLGLAAASTRILRWLFGRREEVHSFRLKPGEGLQVHELPRGK